ncbi:restriction endonuclease subunit S [Winogradskyella sediminis]|uniref:restriction endonuclease subunit S n=1 Tax=Winogradskyella sediminis TaxID=1382466 RepID=UPI000E21E03B|nr:restriction endonuclease subunit S [Winogradskyella sediminis]
MTHTTTHTKSLLPKLRFKEFEGEWEEKKLKDFTKINQGLQIAIAERFTEEAEGLHFYITNEFLRAGSTKKYFIKNPTESVLCNEDDILMTRTGNTGQVVTGVKGAFHNNFFKIKFNSDCDKWFLYYFLTDYKTQHTIMKLAGTSTIPDLNHGDFYRLKINLPNLPEQQKIANFLTAVDTKLQQLTTKKETLALYKKGVMQQLFSQQLRFKPDVIANALKQSHEAISPNETQFPDWEEKRLGEACTFFSGGTPTSTNKEYYSGTIPFIGSGNIYDSEVFSFISEEALNGSSAKIVEKGDLLYALYGANSGEVSISKLSGAINQAVLCIRTNESIEYLYYVLLLNKDRITSKYLQGGQGNLSSKIIKNLKYNFPSLKEQQKIANYLSAIDKKIEAVQTQITQTQAFKKGLLQQMFV